MLAILFQEGSSLKRRTGLNIKEKISVKLIMNILFFEQGDEKLLDNLKRRFS